MRKRNSGETLYWLMKSEPSVYGIHHLERDKKNHWEGVRNYQARNFIKEMTIGDRMLFYHSNANPSGVAGVGKICKDPYPDFFSWDPKSRYFDPSSSPQCPRWFMVDVEYVETFPHFISLAEIRSLPELNDLSILKRGDRLSIHPLSKTQFDFLQTLGNST